MHFAAGQSKERSKLRKEPGGEVRPDGAVAWEPYTDHEPVEISIKCDRMWVPAKENNHGGIPHYARLVGPTEEAKSLRNELSEQMNEAMGATSDEWGEICERSIGVALAVLGEKPKKKHPKPWLDSKRGEKTTLDMELAEAKRKEREARRMANENPGDGGIVGELNSAKRALRGVTKRKKKTLKEWENAWWDEMGRNLTEAHHRGDQGELFRLFGEMKLRQFEGRRDRGKVTVSDVEKEREAWKGHFKKVSEGRGIVKETVWNSVGRNTKTTKWLGDEPWDRELEKCVAKMKTGRATWQDGFAAEMLKYGGSTLRKKVFGVVREMWKNAHNAAQGEEAMEWPEDWKVGLVVPLWKQKGKQIRQKYMEGNNASERGNQIIGKGCGITSRKVGRVLLE